MFDRWARMLYKSRLAERHSKVPSGNKSDPINYLKVIFSILSIIRTNLSRYSKQLERDHFDSFVLPCVLEQFSFTVSPVHKFLVVKLLHGDKTSIGENLLRVNAGHTREVEFTVQGFSNFYG